MKDHEPQLKCERAKQAYLHSRCSDVSDALLDDDSAAAACPGKQTNNFKREKIVKLQDDI